MPAHERQYRFPNVCFLEHMPLDPFHQSVKPKLVNMGRHMGGPGGEELRPQPTTRHVGEQPTDDSSRQPPNLPAEASDITGPRQTIQDLNS